MTEFVYLMSASHSGSTLLTMLLNAHRDVATIGESCAVHFRGAGDTGLCSCGETLAGCRLWSVLKERLAQRGVAVELAALQTEFRLPDAPWADRLLRMEYKGPGLEAVRDLLLTVNPAWRRESARLFASNEALVEEVVRAQGGKVFLDSSKEPHRLKFMMRIGSFRTRVIQLVRDGRGVMASYIRRSQWPPAKAADEWRRSILSEEAILKHFRSEDVIRVRYEDLCREVEPTVGAILTFMGLDPADWRPDFRAVDHHVLGNRMRMQNSSEIRLDERWRETLTAEDRHVFERIAGPLNRRYGYE